MKFTCVKENLVRGLQNVISITGKNIALPILNNVLVRVQGGILELVSTNLEIAIIARVRAKVDGEGLFTVPARSFADCVALIPDTQIELELCEGVLLLQTASSKTKIKGEPAEEYPIIPETEGGTTVSFTTTSLKDGLSQTIFAASRSDVRPELSGVLFHVNPEGHKGELFLVATDSFRLSERRVAVQNEQKEKELRVIVPIKTAQEMLRVLGGMSAVTVAVVFSDNQLSMETDDVRLLSRLVEGTYPDYRQIIPEKFSTEVAVPTSVLSQQVRAASLFSTSGVNAVSFDLKPQQKLGISSASSQLGEFESHVEGDISGEQYNILLNHRYLLDGLQHVDTDTVRLRIVNADAPCLMTPEGKNDYRYIIMPIKQ